MNKTAKGIRELFISLMGVLAARAVFFSINPFGAAYFAAACINKKHRFVLYAATAAGAAAAMRPDGALRYVFLLTALYFVLSAAERKGRKLSPVLAGLAASLMTAAFSLWEPRLGGGWRTSLLLTAMEALLVFSMTHLFYIALSFLRSGKNGQAPGNEELISLAVTCAVALYGMRDMRFSMFSVTESIAYFLILFMGYRYGAGAGAVTGVSLGVAAGLGLKAPGIIGIFCLIGVGAGMFREIGRFAAALAVVILNVSLGVFYGPELLEASYVRGLVSAAVLFCLIPGRYLYRVYSGREAGGEVFARESAESITKRRLKEFSDTFRGISRTFLSLSDTRETLSRQDVEAMVSELSEKLCSRCDKCGRCTIRDTGENYQAAAAIFLAAKERGSVLADDFPAGYSAKCVRFDAFLEETNRELSVASLNLNWQNRMAESREAVAGQLSEVAGMLSEFGRELGETKEMDSAIGVTIAQALRLHRIEVKEIAVVENRNKKQEIYMTVRTGRGRCITKKEAAALVSGIFGKKMRPAGETKNIISKEYDKLILVEDTSYQVLTGIARKSREGEAVNGDNYSVLELENGETVLMLSDGMGFGAGACEESVAVIELLEQLLEAGFSEKSALRLINSILVVKSGQQMFSTLDMSVIDLYTGVCHIVKAGAAAAFIRRRQGVEVLEASALPIGVFNRLDIEERTIQLRDGDFLIMVSDGILDSIAEKEPEEALRRFLERIKSNNPQEIADLILKEAAGQGVHTAADDMTVLAAGFWEK